MTYFGNNRWRILFVISLQIIFATPLFSQYEYHAWSGVVHEFPLRFNPKTLKKEYITLPGSGRVIFSAPDGTPILSLSDENFWSNKLPTYQYNFDDFFTFDIVGKWEPDNVAGYILPSYGKDTLYSCILNYQADEYPRYARTTSAIYLFNFTKKQNAYSFIGADSTENIPNWGRVHIWWNKQKKEFLMVTFSIDTLQSKYAYNLYTINDGKFDKKDTYTVNYSGRLSFSNPDNDTKDYGIFLGSAPKISHTGKFLSKVINYRDSVSVDLLDIDLNTYKLTNYRNIIKKDFSLPAYFLEFSYNDKFLYSMLHDNSTHDSWLVRVGMEDFNDVEKIRINPAGSSIHEMITGPDRHIYISTTNPLGVNTHEITNPGQKDLAKLNIVEFSLDHLFQTSPAGWYDFDWNVKINMPKSDTVCKGSHKTLAANFTPEYYMFTPRWLKNGIELGNTTSYEINNISEKDTGYYVFEVYDPDEDAHYRDSVFIGILPGEVRIHGKEMICRNESQILSATEGFDEYKWNTGETTRELTVNKEGTYFVIVTTDLGCLLTDTIHIQKALLPVINIVAKEGMEFCNGENTHLQVLPLSENYSYKWDTGETTSGIIADESHTYIVTVTDNLTNCSVNDTITVVEYKEAEFTILIDGTLCGNGTVTLTCNEDFPNYSWNTGANTKTINIDQPGNYSLSVTDKNNCSTTKSIHVEKYRIYTADKSPSVYWSKMYVGETVEREFIINNIGEESSDYEINIPNGDFVIMNPPPIFLHGENKLLLSFSPSDPGLVEDSLIIEIKGACSVRLSAYLRGEAYARSEIYFTEHTATPGEILAIPLFIKCDSIDFPLSMNYTAELEWDYSIFSPFETPLFTYNVIAPPNRRIGIKGEIQLESTSQTLAIIEGMAALSNFKEYPLKINSFSLDNPYFEIKTRNGSITPESVCLENLRIIEFKKAFGLSISPNPVTAVLRIETEGNDRIEYELISLIGEIFLKGDFKKELLLDMSGLASGNYHLRLNINGNLRTEQIVIER